MRTSDTAEDRKEDRKPHETLAKMFREDLGVEMEPQALRMFIRYRWGRISPLAHAIHDGE